MNLPLTILLTLLSVGAGTGLCFWLLHKAHELLFFVLQLFFFFFVLFYFPH